MANAAARRIEGVQLGYLAELYGLWSYFEEGTESAEEGHYARLVRSQMRSVGQEIDRLSPGVDNLQASLPGGEQVTIAVMREVEDEGCAIVELHRQGDAAPLMRTDIGPGQHPEEGKVPFDL